MESFDFRRTLRRGVVIPASPLALDSRRKLDERRQRALWRYYSDAGAGGIAVGVHTTQFAIRDPQIGLLRPLLELAADEMDRLDGGRKEPLVRIAGICGRTDQAIREAERAAALRFHAGLLSLAALKDAGEPELIRHCRAVGEVIPVVGFYLQPAVGGRVLPYTFWRAFAEIHSVVAVKIAPFNRYQTLDVIRAVVEAGREDIALYTGNDDSIVHDLITPFVLTRNGRRVERRIVGGLLGHWSVWTRRAVDLLLECHAACRPEGRGRLPDLLARAHQITDCNAAFFDAANGFRGCIAGIHEVLRRQGLLEGVWLLDPGERLSPGQQHEIERVCRAYPHLSDDEFVQQNLDRWLQD
ncbi:MAG: dihydrodipicolinate synthetase [Armatimonadota bacterium]|nr:MAG: dihydrodipicolinate synthetase [Armatimonadota bacterium]